MPAQLIHGINRKRFLAYAIVIAASGILSASNANAQPLPRRQSTTWVITIVATGSSATQTKPDKYTVSRNNTPLVGCPYINNPNDASNLTVCRGDIVQWKAETTKDPYQKMKNEMFISQEDPIQLDKNQNPTQVFHESDGNVAGGKIRLDASLGDHEYYVIVLDRFTNHRYVEDPKIIIGTGFVDDLLHHIQGDCSQLLNLISGDEAKERANKICQDAVKELRNLSHPK